MSNDTQIIQTETKNNEEVQTPIPSESLNAIIQQVDPEKEVEYAMRAAKALMKIVEQKPKKVMMGGEVYLEFEDWQTIGRFYRITAGTKSTEEVRNEKGEIIGYMAKSSVYCNGIVISGADASCLRDEPKWNTRPKYEFNPTTKKREKVGEERVPDFQLKSMAQTRACAKGLRMVLGFVPVLAGYKPTPAEEMDVPEDEPQYKKTKIASSKQKNMIYTLAKERVNTEIKNIPTCEKSLADQLGRESFSFGKLTLQDASSIIGILLNLPKLQ